MTGPTSSVPGHFAFDVDDLIRQAQRDRAGEWRGAPLGYTSDYYTPDEFAAAMEQVHPRARQSGKRAVGVLVHHADQ